MTFEDNINAILNDRHYISRDEMFSERLFTNSDIDDVIWDDFAGSYELPTFVLTDEDIERLKAEGLVQFTIYGEYGINIAHSSFKQKLEAMKDDI